MMPNRRAMRFPIQTPALLCALFCAALAPACGSEDGADGGGAGACDAALWADAGLDGLSGNVHYVATCGVDGAAGTADDPFPTIGDAASAAAAGDTIAVAPGSYPEGVSLAAGVDLVGAGRADVTLKPDGVVGLRIEGSGESTIAGLTIEGAAGAGVHVLGASVQLEGLDILGTTALDSPIGDAPLAGHGVAARDSLLLELVGTAVVGNAGAGVVAEGAGEVAIIDPTFIIDPAFAPTPAGMIDPTFVIDPAFIIDPAFSPSAEISGNAGGGVSIIDPAFAPKADSALALRVEGADIASNTGFGIAMWGGDLSVKASAIHHTSLGATAIGPGTFGDGIIVMTADDKTTTPSTIVTDERTALVSNGRSGLMLAGRAAATIAGVVADHEGGGIWAHGGAASVAIGAKTRVAFNKRAGVAVSKGARLDAVGARIEGTEPATDGEMADSVAVLDKGTADLRDTTIIGGRTCVLLDDVGSAAAGGWDVAVSGVDMHGCTTGCAINHATNPDYKAKFTGEASGNTFDDSVATQIDDGQALPVERDACGSDDDSDAMTVLQDERCVPSMPMVVGPSDAT